MYAFVVLNISTESLTSAPPQRVIYNFSLIRLNVELTLRIEKKIDVDRLFATSNCLLERMIVK